MSKRISLLVCYPGPSMQLASCQNIPALILPSLQPQHCLSRIFTNLYLFLTGPLPTESRWLGFVGLEGTTIFHLLKHSPDGHSDWSFGWVSNVGGKGPSTWDICCLRNHISWELAAKLRSGTWAGTPFNRRCLCYDQQVNPLCHNACPQSLEMLNFLFSFYLLFTL